MEKFLCVLIDNPLFKNLNGDEIIAVLKSVGARTKKVVSGEYVMRVGEATSEMGFVLSGSVLIIQEDLWGHRNIMGKTDEGEIFAEIFAAANGAKLNVSVVAHENGEILFVDINRLLSLRGDIKEQGDKIIKNLISALAKKTMAFNEKVTHISKRSTREKLLSYLSSQAIKQGSPTFTIAFNRQQLADYLCVERAAMCVELSRLQREGVLEYHKNSFKILERDNL